MYEHPIIHTDQKLIIYSITVYTRVCVCVCVLEGRGGGGGEGDGGVSEHGHLLCSLVHIIWKL